MSCKKMDTTLTNYENGNSLVSYPKPDGQDLWDSIMNPPSLSTTIGAAVGGYLGGPEGASLGASLGDPLWDANVAITTGINNTLNQLVGGNVFPLFGNLGATWSNGDPITQTPINPPVPLPPLPPPPPEGGAVPSYPVDECIPMDTCDCCPCVEPTYTKPTCVESEPPYSNYPPSQAANQCTEESVPMELECICKYVKKS
jgi:hypothetical protein